MAVFTIGYSQNRLQIIYGRLGRMGPYDQNTDVYPGRGEPRTGFLPAQWHRLGGALLGRPHSWVGRRGYIVALGPSPPANRPADVPAVSTY